MTERVREILSWYASDNPGTKANLARLLNHGRLGGSGKLVILPVDQGFEHGPGRSFAPNPAGYDPNYHFQLALDAGCNAYAAPLGFIEGGVAQFPGALPLILKLNSHDVLYDEKDPCSSVTGSVKEALRLGCAAVGFTIYPGSSRIREMYEQLREIAEEAKSVGLAVVVWSYPRGSSLSKEGETAIDVVAYAAHIAAELGAHVVKVKVPTAHIELAEAKKVYEKERIPSARSPSASATWCRAPSMAAESSSSRVAPRRATRTSSKRCAASATAAASARSWAGTPSSGRSPTRSSSSTR